MPHMNEKVDLEEAEEDLGVLEKVAQALRNMAGLREDERQGRSHNRNAPGAMAKRENSPERNHDAKVAQAEDWSLSKIEQLFEHSRKSFDAVKPGEIENLMWAKAGVTLIEGITACVDSLDDWSGTMLSAAADLLDKAADTARTAIRRTARDDLGISQKNAQDLGDGTALAVGLMTMSPVIKSARFLGQTAKEAKLIKGSEAVAKGTTAVKKTHVSVENPCRPTNTSYYSTLFQAQLEKGKHYPGKTDRYHFQEANRQLHELMEKDKYMKNLFDESYPGLSDFVKPSKAGVYPAKPSTKIGLTWHHNSYREGLMELIPRIHHRAPGAVQKNLHPNNKGGMRIWGGGRKKLNNGSTND